MSVLAIDQGTSGTKAVVVCPDRGVLAEVDVPVGGLVFTGDTVEQDPTALLASVLEAGRRALRDSGEPVEGVAIGNQGETVLAWDRRDGRPLGLALSWQDRRAQVVTERLRAQGLAPSLEAVTGLPLDPYFAAPKMAYLRDHVLDGLPDGAVLTTVDAWLLHQLTGRYVTDASTASRTLLLDLDTVTWSPEACAVFGLEPERLPEIVPCDARIGRTEAFGSALDVVGVVVDQQAALLAQGCTEPGAAKCTYGTGAFLLATLGAYPTRSSAGLATSVAWAMSDGTTTYCTDGQVYTVGAAVSWLQRVGLIDGPADLDALAAGHGSDGVTFVPTLAGAGAPLWVPGATGTFAGLSLSTTRENLVRAVVEGIAAQVALLVRAVERDLGRPLTTLRVDGGLTRSQVLMQEQADLLGIPVEVYPGENATALGVAALGLRGLHGPGAEDTVVSGWEPSAVYRPGPAPDARLERWERMLHASLAAGSA